MLKSLLRYILSLLGVAITVVTVLFSVDTYRKYAYNPTERVKLKHKIKENNPFKKRG